MSDGKPGFGAVVGDALLHPNRFFEAVKAGRVTARPFWFYLVVTVMGGAGAGMSLAGLAGMPLLTLALVGAFAQLLLGPVHWFVEVWITHLVARWFGGNGARPDTRSVVGFGSLPTMLGVVPYCGVPAALWAVVSKVCGLRVLHGLELGAASFVALMSAASVLILPMVVAPALLRARSLQDAVGQHVSQCRGERSLLRDQVDLRRVRKVFAGAR